jgi:hypothetical protein
MENEIQELINTFINIKDIIIKIVDTKTIIKQKLVRLKEIHSDLIKDNNSKKIFLICLESFHFQYKVMNVETDNMHRNFMLLTNRTFCDYFNLYNILHKVFEEYEIDVPTEKLHPVYKDLEPFFEYKLEDINLVYKNSTELIVFLISKLREKECLVNKYISKSQSGIRIANFINTLEYDNNVLKDKICLYSKYCNFFQTSQLKYFSKLYIKIKALHDEINDDITFHETPWDNVSINEADTLTQVCEERPVSQWDEDTQNIVGMSNEDLEKSEKEQDNIEKSKKEQDNIEKSEIKHVNKKNNKQKHR